jgi:hypothetical protein
MKYLIENPGDVPKEKKRKGTFISNILKSKKKNFPSFNLPFQNPVSKRLKFKVY